MFWLRARMISAEAPRTRARFILTRKEHKKVLTLKPTAQYKRTFIGTSQHGLRNHGDVSLSSGWRTVDHCRLTLLTIASVKDSWFPVEALLSSISTGTTPIHSSCSLVSSSTFPPLTCGSSLRIWRQKKQLCSAVAASFYPKGCSCSNESQNCLYICKHQPWKPIYNFSDWKVGTQIYIRSEARQPNVWGPRLIRGPEGLTHFISAHGCEMWLLQWPQHCPS